jgi:DNA-binding transcriptional LysR family regulator
MRKRIDDEIAVKLGDLRLFLHVVETGHFRLSAERLGVAQSQVSRAIARMEADLGAQLLHRNRKAVSTTDAARALIPSIKKMLAAAGQLQSEAKIASRDQLKTIVIGAPSTIPVISTCSRIIRSFCRANPECRIVVKELSLRQKIEGLLDGSLDVGFSILPMRLKPANIRVEAIQSEPLLLAMPDDHPLSKRDVVPMISLKQQPFIVYSPEQGGGISDLTLEVCTRAGFQPIVSQVAFLIPIAVSLVAAGLGVTFVPASVAAMKVPGVVYRSIDDQRAITKLVLLSRRNEGAELARNFLSISRSWATKHSADAL